MLYGRGRDPTLPPPPSHCTQPWCIYHNHQCWGQTVTTHLSLQGFGVHSWYKHSENVASEVEVRERDRQLTETLQRHFSQSLQVEPHLSADGPGETFATLVCVPPCYSVRASAHLPVSQVVSSAAFLSSSLAHPLLCLHQVQLHTQITIDTLDQYGNIHTLHQHGNKCLQVSFCGNDVDKFEKP